MWTKRAPWIGTILLTFLVGGLWLFPSLWYTKADAAARPVWLLERTNIVGWKYHEVPVTESAERLLVADRTVNGEFTREGGRATVRVFSAKRYSAKPNDIGLFVHTPDRCWTQGGWKLEPVTPDQVEVTFHGVRMVFERRVFVAANGQPELVYFGGLVGGQPVPYRLDHNMSVGMKYAMNKAAKARGTAGAGMRAADQRFWQRIWDAFTSRRQILGPKQFIRISTPVIGSNLEAGDRLLQRFLETWLTLEDYEAELKAWQTRKA